MVKYKQLWTEAKADNERLKKQYNTYKKLWVESNYTIYELEESNDILKFQIRMQQAEIETLQVIQSANGCVLISNEFSLEPFEFAKVGTGLGSFVISRSSDHAELVGLSTKIAKNQLKLKEVVIKQRVCLNKEKKHDTVVQSLRDVNNKLLTRIKNQNINAGKTKMQLKQLNDELADMKRSFADELSFKISDRRLSLKTTRDRLKMLENAYEQYKNNHDILERYARLDNYIQRKCEDATGWYRDYRKGIFNSINDFVCITNVNEMVEKDYQLTIDEFKNMYWLLKKKRNAIAHPDVSEENECYSHLQD